MTQGNAMENRLADYSARNLRMLETSRGIAWTADILKNGKVIGQVENKGDGSANFYTFKMRTEHDAFRAFAKEHYSKTNPCEPESDFVETLLAVLETAKK